MTLDSLTNDQQQDAAGLEPTRTGVLAQAPGGTISRPGPARGLIRELRESFRNLRRARAPLFVRAFALVRAVKVHFAPDGGPLDRLYDRWLAPLVRPFFPPLPIETPPPAPVLEWELPAATRIDDLPRLALDPVAEPLVSILVPVHNHWRHTYACLSSVLRHSRGIAYEVLLLDDASTDETTRLEQRISGLRVLRNAANLGFLRNCNAGARAAQGRYLVLLNNDTCVHPGWLEHLLAVAEAEPGVGLVGAKLLDEQGRLQEAGGVIWRDGSAGNHGRGEDPMLPAYCYRREVDYCSAACLLVRREVWDRIGGFDERYQPAYYEDADLAFAARQLGFKTVLQPRALVTHLEGVSHGRDLSRGTKRHQELNREKFRQKWQGVLQTQLEPGPERAFLARENPRRSIVLVANNCVPTWDADAGSRAVYDQIRLLGELGYKVVLLPADYYPREPYVSKLQDLGVEVLCGGWMHLGLSEWLRKNGGHIEIAWLNRPQVASQYLDALRLHTRARIIYQACDLHSLREQRRHQLTQNEEAAREAARWRDVETALVETCDVTYFYSAHEARLLREQVPGRPIRTVPLFFYDRLPLDGDAPHVPRADLLFVGGSRHSPNEDAVLWFVREVLPKVRQRLPEVRLRVVGSDPTTAVRALHGPEVEVLGWLSDQGLAHVYRHSRLAVVPVRCGAGVNGKLLEALAWGVPVVTTPNGAEGLIEPGDALSVATTAEGFAERVVALYTNPEAWEQQRASGVAYMRSRFSKVAMKNAIHAEFPDRRASPLASSHQVAP